MSISSSSKKDRANVTFDERISTLSTLGNRVDVIRVEMSSLSLHQQVELTSTASFFVSVVGGGTSTANVFTEGSTFDSFLQPNKIPGLGLLEQLPSCKGPLGAAEAVQARGWYVGCRQCFAQNVSSN